MKMFKSYQLTRACRAPKKVESCVIVKDKPLPLEGGGLQKKYFTNIYFWDIGPFPTTQLKGTCTEYTEYNPGIPSYSWTILCSTCSIETLDKN